MTGKTMGANPKPDGDPVAWLGPRLRRIRAPNPSPMTERGTNTYLIGAGGGLALIDPGPMSRAHLDAILGALGPDESISHIFVTHAHLDHSQLARPLADATGAPILAFGPATAGRSPRMNAWAELGELGGGEGVDGAFAPDIALADGARIAQGDWTLAALHTPGHFGNHLAFVWDDQIFTGDVVMGWASSLVSPPDGDMADYMASLERLAAIPARRLLPGHGAPIDRPEARVAELRAHRRSREVEILAQLTRAPATLAQLRAAIYRDVEPALWPAAERNILAHLLDLMDRKRVDRATGPLHTAVFTAVAAAG